MSPALQARLERASFAGLWLFAAVALLSIAMQNVLFIGFAAFLLIGRIKPHPALAWAWPFLLAALLASFLSENASHSLETWRKWGLMLAAWYAGSALNEERPLRAVLGSLLFFSALWCLGASVWALKGPASALGSGETLAGVMSRLSQEGDWRAVSGSGGYMVLGTGSMLLLCLFSGLALEDAAFRKPLPLACLGALALALLLTQTRSAWLGAAVGVGGLLLWRKPGLALAAAVLLALAAGIPGSPLRARLAQGLDMSQDSTRERVYMQEAGLAIIASHPWLGVGDAMESFDGKEGYYRRYMPEAAKVWDTTRNSEHGHLHNDLIQVAAMYGIPALLLLLALFLSLAAACKPLWRSHHPLARGLGLGWGAACLAWWINGMLEFNFGSFQSGFTFWFITGLMLAATRLREAA